MMHQTKVKTQRVNESELFAYIRDNEKAAQELYRALAGNDNGDAGKIELREKAGAYFLVKEGGATFAFSKKVPDKHTEQ